MNSGLVKVENCNVIKSVEDYVVRRIDSEIEQGKSERITIASELH